VLGADGDQTGLPAKVCRRRLIECGGETVSIGGHPPGGPSPFLVLRHQNPIESGRAVSRGLAPAGAKRDIGSLMQFVSSTILTLGGETEGSHGD